MKTLTQLVNRRYDSTLLKNKAYKKKYTAMCALLKEYDIAANAKEDTDCFDIERIYTSLLVKRRFEDVFFDTYVEMFDYWKDLSYLERKKQINIEIAKLTKDLPHFMYEGKPIYMPCFHERFNHLYSEEIVLLDLKQYHVFIRTCAKEVCAHRYGWEGYAHGFCGCEVIASASLQEYVLYHPLMKRFYRYQNDRFQDCFSLDPKQQEAPKQVRQALAEALLRQDEDTLWKMLLEYPLVDALMQKKLIKYKKKIDKKQEHTKE